MAGMICTVKDCGHSSNDARPPQCTMAQCPGRQTFMQSDFQKKPASERLANLKAAFVENNIPWPPDSRGEQVP